MSYYGGLILQIFNKLFLCFFSHEIDIFIIITLHIFYLISYSYFSIYIFIINSLHNFLGIGIFFLLLLLQLNSIYVLYQFIIYSEVLKIKQ